MKSILLVLLGLLCFIPGCRYVSDASDTAYKEFKPSTLLKKYEYFKDVHAQLDAKLASISTFEAQLASLKSELGTDRAKWAKEDREQYNLQSSQVSGMKASFNILAGEYNSAMVKFNYAFCNVGTLPQGATEALPREYVRYVSN